MSEMDGAIAEFAAESEEILQRVSQNLGRLERGEKSHDILDELYRDMHTTKGSAQLLGYGDIAVVAHAMETCLDPVRRSSTPPNQFLIDALFSCVKVIEELIVSLRGGRTADLGDRGKIAKPLGNLFHSACRQFGREFVLTRDNLLPPFVYEIASRSVSVERSITPRMDQDPGQGDRLVKSQIERKAAEEDGRDREHKKTAAELTESAGEHSADTTIRVQVGLLDNLMNLVGEMVLVRNQVLQHSSRSEDLGFLNLSQRLDVVTSELQDQVMRTRMQPIGNVLGKFQRLIRDLARDMGKNIDLTLQGKDTELDKTLLEAVKDPLTHIVRNSCDHGVEPPDARTKNGKPATGHILIRAFHEGGQVIVEISDDGSGLNRQKILNKAIERGLLTAEAGERLSDREKMNLIFVPGLSTAQQVSSVSGRGVGMDVVKTNIEKIGGSVELESVEGKGSTVRLRIPLTLAIVPAMLVRSGRDEYAIPQIKLVELVRVEMDESSDHRQSIRFVQGKPVYELRGKLLPLVCLGEILRGGRCGVESARETVTRKGTVNIVVLNAEGEYFGLVVDEVLDTADIVVKPLSKFLKSLEIFSAATILGSGRVALILDPMGIAKVGQLILEKRNTEGDFRATPVDTAVERDIQEYLLFRVSQHERYALPLCMVNRLEEFAQDQVEYSGRQEVIRYRGSILPLIDVNNALGFGGEVSNHGDRLPTIVIQRGGRLYGLLVSEIVDVATVNCVIDDNVKDRQGVLGSMIHGDEVVVVVDALGIIECEAARFAGTQARVDQATAMDDFSGSAARKTRILYAEDVAFFRRQVTKLLTNHGYDVVAVEDGSAALAAFKAAKERPFSLVLSDIEMPRMNGIQLARAVRELPEGQTVPLVALTTRFRQRDIAEGNQAGYQAYLEKLNPDTLISNINKLLGREAGHFEPGRSA